MPGLSAWRADQHHLRCDISRGCTLSKLTNRLRECQIYSLTPETPLRICATLSVTAAYCLSRVSGFEIVDAVENTGLSV